MTAPETLRLIQAYGRAAMALGAGGSDREAGEALAVLLEHLRPDAAWLETVERRVFAFGGAAVNRGIDTREGRTTGVFDHRIETAYIEARDALLTYLRSQVPAQPADLNNIIAGALFDLMGSLTSGETRWKFSAYDDAAPGVQALEEFAKLRGLRLEEARVRDWHTALSAAQMADWVSVPVTPTEAMVDAAEAVGAHWARTIWTAMLDAAPVKP